MPAFSTADLALARRFEAAEAANGASLANGSSTVEAAPLLGGTAIFAGAGNPFTHALGIGMNGPCTEAQFDELEAFFFQRGSASLIDLCPMADPTVVDQVTRRGYQIIEFNNVMVRRLTPPDASYTPSSPLVITEAGADRHHEWCRTVMTGFSGSVTLPPEAEALLEGMPQVGTNLFAEWDGAVAGAAAMGLPEPAAHFYGDATLLHARGRGIQQALIRHRLALAVRAGREWAMACVIPGSGSHRNYERCGFELLYMRVNVMRPMPA